MLIVHFHFNDKMNEDDRGVESQVKTKGEANGGKGFKQPNL
jgi:hypothetical protein